MKPTSAVLIQGVLAAAFLAGCKPEPAATPTPVAAQQPAPVVSAQNFSEASAPPVAASAKAKQKALPKASVGSPTFVQQRDFSDVKAPAASSSKGLVLTEARAGGQRSTNTPPPRENNGGVISYGRSTVRQAPKGKTSTAAASKSPD